MLFFLFYYPLKTRWQGLMIFIWLIFSLNEEYINLTIFYGYSATYRVAEMD
jgi:hypothetical protein